MAETEFKCCVLLVALQVGENAEEICTGRGDAGAWREEMDGRGNGVE